MTTTTLEPTRQHQARRSSAADLFTPLRVGPYTPANRVIMAPMTRNRAEDHADAVAWGALFLANPELPERFRRGATLNVPDPSTFYGGTEKGYTDYPTLSA